MDIWGFGIIRQTMSKSTLLHSIPFARDVSSQVSFSSSMYTLKTLLPSIKEIVGESLLTLTKYFRDQFSQVSLTKSRETCNYICLLLRPNSFTDKSQKLQWLHLKTGSTWRGYTKGVSMVVAVATSN